MPLHSSSSCWDGCEPKAVSWAVVLHCEQGGGAATKQKSAAAMLWIGLERVTRRREVEHDLTLLGCEDVADPRPRKAESAAMINISDHSAVPYHPPTQLGNCRASVSRRLSRTSALPPLNIDPLPLAAAARRRSRLPPSASSTLFSRAGRTRTRRSIGIFARFSGPARSRLSAPTRATSFYCIRTRRCRMRTPSY